MKYTNEASCKTALAYGCKPVGEFEDEENGITRVFAISREEWILSQKILSYEKREYLANEQLSDKDA